MDLDLAPEHNLLRSTVRDFMESEVAPVIDEHEKARRFPSDVVHRLGEMGWLGIPIAEWLRGPLRGMMLDLLGPARLKRQGILDPAAVTGLIQEHLEGRRDNRKQIWTLLMMQLWAENWGRARAREAVTA